MGLSGTRESVATGTQGRGQGTATTSTLAQLLLHWSCNHFSGQAESSGNWQSLINCRGITAICTGSALPLASGVLKIQLTGSHVCGTPGVASLTLLLGEAPFFFTVLVPSVFDLVSLEACLATSLLLMPNS